jgi:hypothetical protein
LLFLGEVNFDALKTDFDQQKSVKFKFKAKVISQLKNGFPFSVEWLACFTCDEIHRCENGF